MPSLFIFLFVCQVCLSNLCQVELILYNFYTNCTIFSSSGGPLEIGPRATPQSALELGPSHCRNGRLGQDLGFGRFAFALKLPKLSSPLIGLAKRPPFISINLCCLGRNRPEGHSKSTRGPYAASGLDLTAQMKRYGDVGLSVNMGLCIIVAVLYNRGQLYTIQSSTDSCSQRVSTVQMENGRECQDGIVISPVGRAQ